MKDEELKELVAATSRTIDRLGALAEKAELRRRQGEERRLRLLAAIEAPAQMRDKALRHGIYLTLVGEDAFELFEPDGFRPRDFTAA